MGTESSIIFDGKMCFQVIHKQFMNELHFIYRSAYSSEQGLRQEKKGNRNGDTTIPLKILYPPSSAVLRFLKGNSKRRRKKNGRKERKKRGLGNLFNQDNC